MVQACTNSPKRYDLSARFFLQPFGMCRCILMLPLCAGCLLIQKSLCSSGLSAPLCLPRLGYFAPHSNLIQHICQDGPVVAKSAGLLGSIFMLRNERL